MSPAPRGLLCLSGAVLSACVLAWVLQGDQTGRVALYLGLYATAFGAYLVALHAASAASLAKRGLRWALAVGLAWRLVLAFVPPLLSDDAYRSVWEGRIQHHGGNPYAWSDRPEAERWAGLRDASWQRVNHKDYTAVYPPLWQLAVRGVTAVHDSVTALKLFLVGCEALTLWALACVLRRRGLPGWRLLILAWSPLSIVEVAGSGHNDAFGSLFLALALAGLEAGRPLAAAVACALGMQAKLLPGVVALGWLRRFRPFHVAIAGGVAAVLVWPYAAAGRGLWRSLAKYGEFWRFNETLFAGLAAISATHAAAVQLSLALLGLISVTLAWKRTEAAITVLAVVIAWLLLAPSVLPWYALWLLPPLVVRECPGALLFTGTVGLSYLVYPAWQAGGPWQVSWQLRLLEYGPCLLLAILARRREASDRRSA